MTILGMSCDEARDLAAAYVLGALEPIQDAAVRDHRATCTEPHAEFEELGGVVPAFIESELDNLELVEPPPALRERIMAAAAADLAVRSAARTGAEQAVASAPARPIAFPSGPEREARRERSVGSRLDWALRIAAVFAIVAVGAWGLGLQRQLEAAQRFDQAVARVVDVASQPGASTVVLAPAKDGTGKGIAAVAPDGTVILAMRDLPATHDSQVYETWVINGEQPPVAVGGFTVDSNGTAAFTTRPATTAAGSVIALTLEPNPGNTAPQGPIVSAGTATAPGGATS